MPANVANRESYNLSDRAPLELIQGGQNGIKNGLVEVSATSIAEVDNIVFTVEEKDAGGAFAAISGSPFTVVPRGTVLVGGLRKKYIKFTVTSGRGTVQLALSASHGQLDFTVFP